MVFVVWLPQASLEVANFNYFENLSNFLRNIFPKAVYFLIPIIFSATILSYSKKLKEVDLIANNITETLVFI